MSEIFEVSEEWVLSEEWVRHSTTVTVVVLPPVRCHTGLTRTPLGVVANSDCTVKSSSHRCNSIYDYQYFPITQTPPTSSDSLTKDR